MDVKFYGIELMAPRSDGVRRSFRERARLSSMIYRVGLNSDREFEACFSSKH